LSLTDQPSQASQSNAFGTIFNFPLQYAVEALLNRTRIASAVVLVLTLCTAAFLFSRLQAPPPTHAAEHEAARAPAQASVSPQIVPPPPVPGEPMQPPSAKPPAELGPPEVLNAKTADDQTVQAYLWQSQLRGAPVAVFAAALHGDGNAWLAALQALKAQREVSLVVLQAGPGPAAVIADLAVRDATARQRWAAILALLHARSALQTSTFVLVGAAEAASSALAIAANDATIRGVVALSPQAAPGLGGIAEVLENRPVLLMWADRDAQSVETVQILQTLLHNRRQASTSSDAQGLELLKDSRLRSDLVGWLYTALSVHR